MGYSSPTAPMFSPADLRSRVRRARGLRPSGLAFNTPNRRPVVTGSEELGIHRQNNHEVSLPEELVTPQLRNPREVLRLDPRFRAQNNGANEDPANEDPANEDPANEDPANEDPANEDAEFQQNRDSEVVSDGASASSFAEVLQSPLALAVGAVVLAGGTYLLLRAVTKPPPQQKTSKRTASGAKRPRPASGR